MEKKCSKCKEVKDVNYFTVDRHTKDGFSRNCKECTSIYYEKIKENRKNVIVTEKKCNKCGKIKKVIKFYKNSYSKTGYMSMCIECRKNHMKKETIKRIEHRNKKNYKQITEKRCNGCGKVRNIEYFYEREGSTDGFATKCKICFVKYSKENAERIALRQKKNKKHIRLQQKKYKEKNKIELKLKTIEYRNSNAKYKSFYKKLTIDESPRLHKDGKSLEVLCKYCGKYFIPKSNAVVHRVSSLNGYTEGDRYLYCSENCKLSCPTYGQVKYPKGFKKISSREVNPLIRQMCFERDNWECQICGKLTDEVQLHCHHIEGYTRNQRLGNDIHNVITLCIDCHKYVHTLPGCRYSDLRCKSN